METSLSGARLALVIDDEERVQRGRAIEARRKALGLTKHDLGVSHTTLTKIEAGQLVTEKKLQAVEAALALREAMTAGGTAAAAGGTEVTELGGGMIEFTASIGALDVRFTAKGSPEHADLLRRQVVEAVEEAIRESRSE